MIIETLKCPNCGAAVSMDMKQCAYCSSPVIIRTVNNFTSPIPEDKTELSSCQISNHNMSTAYRLLEAKLYDRALAIYELVIAEDFNNADAHFFAAVASLKGKRPFLASVSAIKQAESYLSTAIAIEPKGIYYYFWSYIRLDHHFKKFFKVSPDYKELYRTGSNIGLSQTDINDLYDVLGVKRPDEI